jgi:hypothetical protein
MDWRSSCSSGSACNGRSPAPILIALAITMIRFYRDPLPGIGRSVSQLLTDQALYLAHRIETTQVQQISDRLNELFLGLERPTVLNILHIIGYLIVSLAVTAARTALLAVIAFGLVATAIAVLLGPVFIPWILVPPLDWLFWGWLRSLVQYAFYQVVAQAFAFVFGSFLINFLDAFPPPYTVDRLFVGGLHIVALLMAFTYGMLQVPSLTNSLFSGKSGEAALPRRIG